MANTKKTETRTEPRAEMRRPVMSQSFYMGPSIKGVISTRTIFTGDISGKIDEVAKRAGVARGMAEALFVPIDKLSEAEEHFKTQSKLNTCYKAVIKALNKEVER